MVAINDALLYLEGTATVLFSADVRWMSRRRWEIERFKGEKYLAVTADVAHRPIAGVTYLEKRYDVGLSRDLNAVHIRGSSGYAALNLAYLKGSYRIILLGYDFMNNGHKRWYGDDSGATNDWVLENWAKEFDVVGRQLNKVNVEVVNACMTSRIVAFPKVEVESVLELQR